jgi:hypothetical protein
MDRRSNPALRRCILALHRNSRSPVQRRCALHRRSLQPRRRMAVFRSKPGAHQ